jgi:hypothetical protein
MTKIELNALIAHHEEVLHNLNEIAKANHRLNYEKSEYESCKKRGGQLENYHKKEYDKYTEHLNKLITKYRQLQSPAPNYINESITLQNHLS